MKLALIDRDGVINDELPYYVKSVEEFAFLPNALEGLALLHRRGFTCVVITNQSVVGRGIISQAMLDRIHGHMCETVKAHGGEVSEVIACTDTPDKASYRRKPKPGMLLEALERYKAEPEKTPFIGDASTDMEAAVEAGCMRYLVMTGKGEKTFATLKLKPSPSGRGLGEGPVAHAASHAPHLNPPPEGEEIPGAGPIILCADLLDAARKIVDTL